MASTDLLAYAICVSNRPLFPPHMSVPNKQMDQMAYPAAALGLFKQNIEQKYAIFAGVFMPSACDPL